MLPLLQDSFPYGKKEISYRNADLPHSKLVGSQANSEPSSLLEWLACQDKTDLKSSSTACGKVWKLLFRLICVPSTMAIFPNICKTHCQVPSTLSQALTSLQSTPVPELLFLIYSVWVSPTETEMEV